MALASSCGDLEIPEPLKSELPEYPGARLRAVSTDGRGGAGLTFETEDDAVAVLRFYTEEAEQQGWEPVAQHSPSAHAQRRHWRRGPYLLRVHTKKASRDEPMLVSVDIMID